ncbi:sensor histidine kinase [Natrinema caseinilyticum]|uniref:sensor histidine kinase n=1 Tax=Natrinema caseinilyticum TaxID=2961570 RepID=UPI0020C29542|nr:HAMP domain-containing sensor histidine kinase [Natrinema caseinilyticum]
MTEPRGGARTDEPDAVAIDAIPEPVLGYDLVDGTPKISVTNDAFDAAFDAASNGTSVHEWLVRNGAVDEATVGDACTALADGNAIDVEIGVRSADDADPQRRPVRLRSVGRSNRGNSDDGTDGGDAVDWDGYVLVTQPASKSTGNVELDRVASVITHDLRNPLDVAKAHLRAAKETGESDHFDQVEDAHDRMERIIRDALTLARGERALDVTADVEIGAVASDAWAIVDTGTASLDVAENLPRIDADPDRLQRLFENLFRNAVEHGSTGGQDATNSNRTDVVRVRVGSVDGGFFVADDGVGIPPDERERVFEPGYSSTETGSGTGLGLTIVEQIARAHEWCVSIAEGSSGGARFGFRPIADDD